MTEENADTGSRSRRTVLAALGSLGLGVSGPVGRTSGTSTGGTLQSAEEPIEYVGTATTTVTYLDSTSGEVLRREVYENPVSVELGPPLEVGLASDRNQFHLSIIPRVPLLFKNEDAEGDVQTFSALALQTELFHYWDLLVESGSEFTGTLVDNHLEDGNTYNWLNAWRPGTQISQRLVMSEGSIMSGSISGDSISITMNGNTVEGTTPFESTVIASQ